MRENQKRGHMKNSVTESVRNDLLARISHLETVLGGDVLTIHSPILFGIDQSVRTALEQVPKKKKKLYVILNTPGGIAEVVERIVNTIRHFYQEVAFLIPDRAMSAGTILVISGDEIWMDYYSCLGPIDPQIQKDNRLIPALAYLKQFERLIEKANNGQLSTAEAMLLGKLDLAELHQFEQARELSISLLTNWLAKYKFKHWTTTETQKKPVTPKDKEERAEEIARLLSDNEKWHSHGRGIGIETLRQDLNLKINSFDEIPELPKALFDYFKLFMSFVESRNIESFVHNKGYF